MSTTKSGWLGNTSPIDSAHVSVAPGGALSDLGRQAAIEASLALLGVYFSGGDQERKDFAAISGQAQDPELDAIHAGLRLRVALAAGRRLSSLLTAVSHRPTFRYELRSTEHVGSLGGALDINRWITRQRGDDQDVTFPVLEVSRGTRTPENTLACYATQWLMTELKLSLSASIATKTAVEYRDVRSLRRRLESQLRSPALSACVREAQGVRTQSALDRLIGSVKRRLRRRDIAHPTPYRELVQWVENCLHGAPAVRAGELDLSVYGESFDNKLFELWCLSELGRSLAEAVNLPDPAVHAGWRGTAPAYRLDTFTGRLELYFQRGIASVDKRRGAKWRKESGRPLGGIPDIVVGGTTASGEQRIAVVDPKLRQRNRLPAEEIYKVLGYLQNFNVQPAIGVVLIYTTDADLVSPDVFHDSEEGVLVSASLNPAAPADVTRTALTPVVKAILGMIEYEMVELDPSSRNPEAPREDPAENTIASFRNTLTTWGQQHLSDIAPSRERIRTLVGSDRWDGLNEDVRTMVATADLVGYQLDPTADFSGPVIGMCAAVEHVLYAGVISPVVDENTSWQRQTRTFGGAIDSIEHACENRNGDLSRTLRKHMEATGVNLAATSQLIDSWRTLNKEYRIPAAHRAVLSKSSWGRLYRLVMGTESLFAKTYDVLRPRDSS